MNAAEFSVPRSGALLVIQRILLVFWAAWLSVVVATNVIDALIAMDVLPKTVHFASGNWRAINEAMDPIGAARGFQAFLFAGAIAWEAFAAVFFWWAATTYRGRPLSQEKITLLACGVNLALWAAFQVMDEVLMSYPLETTHRAIFISQLVTLLVLHMLPNSPQANRTE